MAELSSVVDRLRRGEWLGPVPAGPESVRVARVESRANSVTARIVHQAAGVSRTYFVKMLYPDLADGRSNRSDREYKEGQIQDEFTVLERLWNQFSSEAALGVVRPVACFPEELAIVTEEAAGTSLSAYMEGAKIHAGRRRLARLLDLCERCGTWLRLFQAFTRDGQEREYDFGEIVDYCDVRLARLSSARPREVTEALRSGVRGCLERTIAEARRGVLDVAARHNDFGPQNIIVDGDRIVVLDFGGFNHGPACSDYVRFWSQLELMASSPLVTRATVRELQAAFARGYGDRLDERDPLFSLFRIAFVLDKMDDVWLGWSSFPWYRKISYRRLHDGSLAWLVAQCGLRK
jgi:hypothetical protein